MARNLIGEILERMPDKVIDLDRVEPHPHQGASPGRQHIPATFTPGPRRGPRLTLE
jgi:hypothetical protein